MTQKMASQLKWEGWSFDDELSELCNLCIRYYNKQDQQEFDNRCKLLDLALKLDLKKKFDKYFAQEDKD